MSSVEHRVAHCGQESLFFEHGYYIGLDPKLRKQNKTAIESDRMRPFKRRGYTPSEVKANMDGIFDRPDI